MPAASSFCARYLGVRPSTTSRTQYTSAVYVARSTIASYSYTYSTVTLTPRTSTVTGLAVSRTTSTFTPRSSTTTLTVTSTSRVVQLGRREIAERAFPTNRPAPFVAFTDRWSLSAACKCLSVVGATYTRDVFRPSTSS